MEVATEIIDSIPVFLARARQEARKRGLESVAGPLLDQAELYFLRPLDLMPEMTQGLVGLLDDSYLVVRTLESLDRGPQPFLDWDLDYPARFLRRLIGGAVANRLAADSQELVPVADRADWPAPMDLGGVAPGVTHRCPR